MPRTRRGGAAVMATLVLLVASAGCGNDNSDRAAGLTDARADTTVEGRVTVTGSSTVQPVSAVAAEAFRGQNDAVDISVEGPGTGDGLERFCEGGADIAGASRPIQPEELAACEAAGIEVIELPIGRDGITVIVSTENQVPCLSFVDLYALVGPESSGFDRWRDAGDLAFDLRSELRFPDDRLVVTGPGEESGTYDSFVEQVLDPVTTRRIAEGVTGLDPGTARADYAASADDNTIVEGVAAEPGGLGWVSFAYAEQAEGVREMPVARMPSEGCVAPTREAIQSGRYPIARALYLYVARGRADDPAVAAFVDFYLAGLDDFVAMSDYVPLADPEATVEVWEGRVVGSREGEPAEG